MFWYGWNAGFWAEYTFLCRYVLYLAVWNKWGVWENIMERLRNDRDIGKKGEDHNVILRAWEVQFYWNRPGRILLWALMSFPGSPPVSRSIPQLFPHILSTGHRASPSRVGREEILIWGGMDSCNQVLTGKYGRRGGFSSGIRGVQVPSMGRYFQ